VGGCAGGGDAVNAQLAEERQQAILLVAKLVAQGGGDACLAGGRFA
jgi:hypothetical protein